MRARRGGHGREPTVGIHRGSIRPPHGRAADVFHLLSTPCSRGRFRRRRQPHRECLHPAVPAPLRTCPQALGIWRFLAIHAPAPPPKHGTECLLYRFRNLALFFSFRPYFRSYFALALCKCTILEQVPCFALLYVSVLCIFRNSSLVKVCAFAQSLTRPCRPLNLLPTSHSRRPVGNADTALPGAVCRPCHRGVGMCMGVGRPGVRL